MKMKIETAQYNHDGKLYAVNIKRKVTRYSRYYFKNGQFYITAPYTMPISLLKNGIDKFFDRLVSSNPYVTGIGENYIYLLGNKINENEEHQLYFSDGSFIKYKDIEDLAKKLKKWFLIYIISRVRYYEKIMNTVPNTVKIRKMTSRYGSNNMTKHILTFSNVLMHFSQEIIDSVVVHELAHCFEGNHSKNFYKVIDKYYPNYKECHTKLTKGEFK